MIIMHSISLVKIFIAYSYIWFSILSLSIFLCVCLLSYVSSISFPLLSSDFRLYLLSLHIYPTIPHLFQEIVHYGMPYLRLHSLIPTLCFLSNLTSTNFVLFPSLHSLSLSSFVGRFAVGLKAFPQHHLLKQNF